jgi:hypothetical protein
VLGFEREGALIYLPIHITFSPYYSKLTEMLRGPQLHRDTLAPLYPVYAVDFLSLAPHALEHDDFEVRFFTLSFAMLTHSFSAQQTSQREILEAFSFSLRGHNTPQPIMDEVYLALPTLRALLWFKGGWEDAKREAWKRLLGAVSGGWIFRTPVLFFLFGLFFCDPLTTFLLDTYTEPDILRFPISLLTISALISGIIIALINHYEAEAEAIIWRQQQSLHETKTCTCNSAVSCAQRDSFQDAQVQAQRRFVRRAVKAAGGVILDLQDLLGVGDVSSLVFEDADEGVVLILFFIQENLRECRMWQTELGH